MKRLNKSGECLEEFYYFFIMSDVKKNEKQIVNFSPLKLSVNNIFSDDFREKKS